LHCLGSSDGLVLVVTSCSKKYESSLSSSAVYIFFEDEALMKTSIESSHISGSGSSVSDPDEIDESDYSTELDGTSAPRTLKQQDITSYTRPIQRKPRGSATSAARPMPRGFLGALRARELGRSRRGGGSMRTVLPSVSAASCGVGSSGAGPAWAGRLLAARVELERIWLGAHNSGLTGGAALGFGVHNGRGGPSCMAFGGDGAELVAVGGPGPVISVYDVDTFLTHRRGTPHQRVIDANDENKNTNSASASLNSDRNVVSSECPTLPFTVPRVSVLGNNNNDVDDEVSALVFDPSPGSDEVAVALRRSATVRVFRLGDASEAAEDWANARRAGAAGRGGGPQGGDVAHGSMGALPNAPPARVLVPATAGRPDTGGHTALLYDDESTFSSSSSAAEPTLRGLRRSICSSSALIAGSAHGHIRLWPAKNHKEGNLHESTQEEQQQAMKPTWTVQVKGIDGRPPAPVTALAWVGSAPSQPQSKETYDPSPQSAPTSSADTRCIGDVKFSSFPLHNNRAPEAMATTASISSSSSSTSMPLKSSWPLSTTSDAATIKRSAPLVGLAAARGLAKVPKTTGLSTKTGILSSSVTALTSQKVALSSATAERGSVGLKKAVGLKAAKQQGRGGLGRLISGGAATGGEALTGGLPGVKRALSETRSNNSNGVASSGSGKRLGGGPKMKVEQQRAVSASRLGSWLAPPPTTDLNAQAEMSTSSSKELNRSISSSSSSLSFGAVTTTSNSNALVSSTTADTKTTTKAIACASGSSTKSNNSGSNRNSSSTRRRLLVAGSADGQITVWDCAQLTASKAFGANARKQPLLVATLDAPHCLFRPITCATAAFAHSNRWGHGDSSDGNDKLRQLAEHSREWAGVLSLRSQKKSSSSNGSSSLGEHAALLTVGLRNGWVADFKLSWSSSSSRDKAGREDSGLAIHTVRAAYLPSPPRRAIGNAVDSGAVQQTSGHNSSWDQYGHCSGGFRKAPTALLQCNSATGASVELLLALPSAANGGGDGGDSETNSDQNASCFRPCLELLRATRRRRGGFGGNEGTTSSHYRSPLPPSTTMLAADGFPSAPTLKRGSSVTDSGMDASSSLQAELTLAITNKAAPDPRLCSAYLPLKHRGALAVPPADPLLHRPWPSHHAEGTHRGGGAAPVTALAAHPTMPLALVAFDDGTAAMLLA